jgi:hypothetical protein
MEVIGTVAEEESAAFSILITAPLSAADGSSRLAEQQFC